MRSLRRHHARRIKEKYRKIARRVWDLGKTFFHKGECPKPPIPPKQENLKLVGKAASTHCVNCSCYMCGNPRKYFDEITYQEKIAILNEKEQIDEVNY